MNMNTVGGIAAVAALAAIFYFGTQHVPTSETPKPAPTSDATHHAPASETPKPAPTVVKSPNPKDRNVVYHRVEQGGSKGPKTACASVKPFADGKSQAELQALAKQYGVKVAVVKTWYICTN